MRLEVQCSLAFPFPTADMTAVVDPQTKRELPPNSESPKTNRTEGGHFDLENDIAQFDGVVPNEEKTFSPLTASEEQ